MTDQTPNLSLPYIQAAQAQKHVTHNEAVRALDAIVHLAILSDAQTSPPSLPNNGDRYLVPQEATGSWTGRENTIAAFQDGSWAFYSPKRGWVAWIASAGALRAFNGEAWVAVGGTASVNPAALVGVNATADTTNRLSVSSPASLFNHAGNGHQLKINKSGVADTASHLFQTAFSGRAEVGLAGDDNLRFKVSPDGSTWKDALVIERITGTPRIPAFSLGALPSASTAGAGALIYVSDAASGPAVFVSNGTTWLSLGGGSASLPSVPLFIFIGDSNSGGLAVNASATVNELAARADVKIWNPTAAAFQNLDVGTNNLIGHDAMSDNATHGLELHMANMVAAQRFLQSEVFVLKCGQGGSKIEQWRADSNWRLASGSVVGPASFTSSGTGSRMWEVASARITAALAAMQAAGKNPVPYVFLSIGLNDASGSSTYSLPATTDWAAFRTDVESLITRLRGLLGASTPVLMTKFLPPIQETTSANAQFDAIDAADANAIAVSSAGCATNAGDNRHWSYAGYKLLGERMVDAALSFSGTAAAPTISPASGTYTGAQTVTITPAAGALRTLYVTDPAADPLQGTLYSAPFSVTPPAAVRAITIERGKASAQASVNYLASTVSAWSATDAGSNFTLSSANRVAGRTGTGPSYRSIRGDTSKSSGKRVFALKKISGPAGSGQFIAGVAQSSASMGGQLGSTTAGAFGAGSYRCGTNFSASNLDTTAIWAAWGGLNVNSYAICYVDLDAGRMWFGAAGSPLGGANPAAGTGAHVTWTPATVGALFPGLSLFNADGTDGTWEINTSAAQLAALGMTLPSGFVAWDA